MELITTQIQARNSWEKWVNQRKSIAPASQKRRFDSCRRNDNWLIFLNCSWLEFELWLIPLGTKILWTFRIYPTSSEVPQNHNWFTLTYSQALLSLKYTLTTLALVSCLYSSVARALHRHRKSVGSIPAGGPIVESFFSTVSGLNLSWD